MPKEPGRLEPFPTAFHLVPGEIHETEVGVQLGIEGAVGVVRDDGGDRVAARPVVVPAAAADPGGGDRFDFVEGLGHGFTPPGTDTLVAADQVEDRDILGRRNLPEIADAAAGALVTSGELFGREGMEAAAEMLELGQVTLAGQTQPAGTGAEPGHFRLTFLGQVIAQRHVLAEVLHGTLEGEAG